MTNKIKVSIVMITKNRANFLPEALGSVLRQSFQNWELLIIDNGSTSQTQELIAGYLAGEQRIFYSRSALLGVGANRNLALRLAKGEYVAVLDDDDVWLEQDKLTEQVAWLDSHLDYCLIGSWVSLINPAGEIIGRQSVPETDSQIRVSLTRKDNFIHSSVLYRRQFALEVGGYDESLIVGEDYDLWLKLGLKGKFANWPKELAGYRVHPGNMGHGRLKKVLFTGYRVAGRYFKYYPNSFINHLKWLSSIVKSSWQANDTIK
jgi:glycosyltransferase involved in cell wall biosynthesis